jgi:spectrin beta
LKRDIEQLDAWLNVRKPILEDTAVGDSIDAVELMLQKHEDFEKMVFAQEDRFNAIRRLTLVCVKLHFCVKWPLTNCTFDRNCYM